MKKYLSLIISVLLLFSSNAMVVQAADANNLTISQKSISHDVSSTLYGVSLGSESCGIDGGLVSNLVNNNSFENESKPEAYWTISGMDAILSTTDSISKNNPSYESLTVDGKGTITNLGYTEQYSNQSYSYDEDSANSADMGFVEDECYDFSCYVKNVDYDGSISVYLDSKSNSKNVVQLSVSSVNKNDWVKLSTTLKSKGTEDGALSIVFEGTGNIELDNVSLVPQGSYGYGNDNWKYTSLRSDLYTAIGNLNPSFIKFPAGNTTEGNDINHLLNWKDTIGDLTERKQISVTNADNANVITTNSNAMGYHEYFQLCEDLGATAVPIVNAGIASQTDNDYADYYNAYKKLSMNSSEWTAYLISDLGYDEKDNSGMQDYTDKINALGIKSKKDYQKYINKIALATDSDEFANYKQDVLDLIEYANGDSTTTYWGALRSANGHDEPFNIKYIEVGCNNWGDEYWANFSAIKQAISDAYPDITVIASTGSDTENGLKNAATYSNIIADETVVDTDDSIITYSNKLDSYDKQSTPIMLGNYCANDNNAVLTSNNMFAAVKEGVLLASAERNSDIVNFACYNQTLSKINANTVDNSLIWFDSQNVSYTPSYYSQLIMANNTGSSAIDTNFKAENIYQSVTTDADKNVVYVKLINNGSSAKVNINLDGFDKISYASVQYVSNGYKSAYNKLNKQFVAPKDSELEFSDSSLTVSLKSNSVSVVRIAYGDNMGEGLWSIPEDLNLSTKHFVPAAIKVFIAVLCITIPIGGVCGYFIYKKILSNKKKGGKKKKIFDFDIDDFDEE